jgi:hypothetical protein
MYSKLDAPKMSQPFAPIDLCYDPGVYTGGYWRETEFCTFTANDEYRDHVCETLRKYVREPTVDLSSTSNSYAGEAPLQSWSKQQNTSPKGPWILRVQDLDADADRHTRAVTLRNAMKALHVGN